VPKAPLQTLPFIVTHTHTNPTSFLLSVGTNRFAQGLIKPESLYEIFPIMEKWKDQPIFNQVLSGILPAALLALFFALCPLMFKAIANSGAAATSVADAEGAALQYFWVSTGGAFVVVLLCF
jgi:hypothetical protein